MPLLPLVWREKQYHVVMQIYRLGVQQKESVGSVEKEKLEKIGLERCVFGQHTANFFPVTSIDIEIHTTLCLAERYIDQFLFFCIINEMDEVVGKDTESIYQNGISFIF